MFWVSPNNKVVIGGVFDGHGGYSGALASSSAAATARAWLDARASLCESWTAAEWRAALRELFGAMHAGARISLLRNTVHIHDITAGPALLAPQPAPPEIGRAHV